MSPAMNPAISNSAMSTCKIFVVVALGALLGAPGTSPRETAPDSENGRYTFSPSADGMIRLDTRTGTVSYCSNSAAGWACYAVPDERKALDEEIGRLAGGERQAEVRNSRRPASPTTSRPVRAPRRRHRKIEIPLPSDQDVDRVMSLLQRAWKRLVEMANQMQKDVSGAERSELA